jgi:hypothetical protein
VLFHSLGRILSDSKMTLQLFSRLKIKLTRILYTSNSDAVKVRTICHSRQAIAAQVLVPMRPQRSVSHQQVSTRVLSYVSGYKFLSQRIECIGILMASFIPGVCPVTNIIGYETDDEHNLFIKCMYMYRAVSYLGTTFHTRVQNFVSECKISYPGTKFHSRVGE